MARRRKTGIELALFLGLTQHTVGRRLNGLTPFTMIELIRVAAWLDLPLEELVRRAERQMAASA